MSKINQPRWQNPFTQDGLRVPHGSVTGAFQIHEIGTMVLNDAWLHRGVCSPFWRLFYEFSGGAWVKCGDRKINLDPGQLVLLPEGVPFDCGANNGVEHLWLHFSLRMSRPVTANMLTVPLAEEFRGLLSVLRRATAERNTERANHLGMALLHVAFSDLGPEWLAAPSPRLQRVLAWLAQNLSRQITNRELAEQAGLGDVAFIRWFRQATGRTPAVYVTERRIQEACRLLALTDYSIEHIAEDLGFSNRHHFSRVFARHAGCGPAAFRRGGWQNAQHDIK